MPHTSRPAPNLADLAILQERAGAALLALANGGSRPSDALYERYLGLARMLVEQATCFEEESSGFFDLQTLALPLVQQLSVYADHKKAAGDRVAARQLSQEVDQIVASYLDQKVSAAVRRDRAMNAAGEGRFHDALVGLQDSAEVFAERGDVLETVRTELQLANVYEWLGDHDRALQTLDNAHQRVVPMLPQGPPSAAEVESALRRQVSEILTHGTNTREGEQLLALRHFAYEVVQAKGRNYRAVEDYDSAEKLFREARPFFIQMGLAVGVDYHLASIACARRDYADAHRLLRQIAPAFEDPQVRPRLGALRMLQSDVFLLGGSPDKALAAAESGFADQGTYPDLDLGWKLQWRRARALAALNRPVDALAAYGVAMTTADRLRRAPLGYRLDTTFLRDKLPMAQEAIDLACEQKKADDVAWFVELVKSRALSAAISIPRTPLARRSTAEMRFDEISRQVDAIAFARYAGSAPAGAIHERIRLLGERDILLEAIRIREPRWRTLSEPAEVDIGGVRALLGDRTVLVLFHRGSQVIAVAIDAHGSTAGVKQLSSATTEAISRFADNLRRRVPVEGLFDLTGECGVGLEDVLPSEVITRMIGTKMLIVVPHGVLHLIPWACLGIGPRRLFELAAVGILPNLACLPLLDAGADSDPAVALIGAADYSGLTLYKPLTDSALELAEVAAAHPGRVVSPTPTGPEATEEAFWQLAASCEDSYALLHFSGHGSLEATEPLASGLVLTDSTVDAAELLSHPLPFREVVLSACSTAWRPQATRGIELVGDDALGIPASFLEAGARFVLANVPPVRESVSRQFTVAWHRHRRSGLTPLQAYRAVQLDAYAADRTSVTYWAGTTAYGSR
ncbi:CHAT domain-containing protein [Actinopolymorpha cephalotaxi]|uniref:CHAT domain-containing protein n=1 Tax=Actinopolymorpha cephalotaxi TaxID=504797 RepID=A0A1I2SMH2_9ACTN|nr:CHAT domain-containing protein [Actinopolymorpha cephalotaxi]NYH84029.1 tetratricopeptide (TPR) repeat protein [Actinopolymorpha cephalotaxi]SFG53912.1 CHAT domain-containing protein [Actinopolymorpha cephalotaxi]